MPSLDQLKQEIRNEASNNPDKFFPTEVLRHKGFNRGQCENCDTYFWSSDPERSFCGEPECSGGYTFIGNSPIDKEYSYIESWEKYRDFMSGRGYKIIDRYPVVARWRDNVEFVGGSIYCFQPYVVSGEAEPPAPELVIPQPSLRFNDVDNVGITGRHYVLHNHIGQTCFQPPEKYDQDRYFRDMFEFATDELGIPEDKLILHEDAWGGGGNLGASIEFFVDGLELWNQVYMTYRVTPQGYEELDLKVLDMGMGHERITWISHGTETSYECVMPHVLEKMKKITGLEVNQEVWQEFLPHSSLLNVDEVDDIDEKWAEIASELEIDVKELKQAIRPVADLYAVAEHTRALLFALSDGKIPSSAGGGHNLRMVYRRTKEKIEKNNWELSIEDIAEWHVEELEPMFPELRSKINSVKKILEVEEEKYMDARERAEQKLGSLKEEPSIEEMIELYESHGVTPEMMREKGFEVPEDFYAQVATEDESLEEAKERFNLENVPDTELLYYKNEEQKEMEAEVTATRGDWVALDKTVFYPEGGGQDPDYGKINEEKVIDVQKQGSVVLHKIENHSFSKGDNVSGEIDWSRRLQLMQHHSMTHAVNGAAREVLGDHIWQAGAHKTTEKARLDVTHYEKISTEQLDELEEKVKEIIEQDLPITKQVLNKTQAEEKYGFRLYQGGAPPGNQVRIISIGEIDHEACGGTHLSRTSEAENFVITGSKKIQDGVIRIEYKAGDAATKHLETIEKRIREITELVKNTKSIKEGVIGGDPRAVQRELCTIYSVEPDQLSSTIERFQEENRNIKKDANALADFMSKEIDFEKVSKGTLTDRCKSLYNAWKENEKQLESLENSLHEHLSTEIKGRHFLIEDVPTNNIGLLIQVTRRLAKENQAAVALKGRKGGVAASQNEKYDADELLERFYDEVQGDETFAKAFN